MNFLSNVANSIPVVGHIKGICHYVAGDKEGGDKAMYQSTRTTAVLGAGAVGSLGGPVGAAAAAMYAGALTDAIASTAMDKPQGFVKGCKNIEKDISEGKNPIGSIASTSFQVGMDGLGGIGMGSISGAASQVSETAVKQGVENIAKSAVKTVGEKTIQATIKMSGEQVVSSVAETITKEAIKSAAVQAEIAIVSTHVCMQAEENTKEDEKQRDEEERERREREERERREREERERRERAERERREREERERREREERERREREEREQREREQRTREERERHEREQQAQREREQNAQREREQQAQREREQQAQREREQQAQREREDQERREREQRTREERQRHEREQQAQREREQQVQREREQQAQREREQQVQREREQQAQREREQQAQREREQQAQREREQQAQREREQQTQREREDQERREREQGKSSQEQQEQPNNSGDHPRRNNNNKRRPRKPKPNYFGIFMDLLAEKLNIIFGNSVTPERTKINEIFSELSGGQIRYLEKKIETLQKNGLLEEVLTLVIKMFAEHYPDDISFLNFLSLMEFVAVYIQEEIDYRIQVYRMSEEISIEESGTATTQMNSEDLKDTVISTIMDLVNIIEIIEDIFTGIKSNIEYELEALDLYPNFRDMFSAIYHYFKHRCVPGDGLLSVREYYDWIRNVLRELDKQQRYADLLQEQTTQDVTANVVFDIYVVVFGRRIRLVVKFQGRILVLASCFVLDDTYDGDKEGDVWIIIRCF